MLIFTTKIAIVDTFRIILTSINFVKVKLYS